MYLFWILLSHNYKVLLHFRRFRTPNQKQEVARSSAMSKLNSPFLKFIIFTCLLSNWFHRLAILSCLIKPISLNMLGWCFWNQFLVFSFNNVSCTLLSRSYMSSYISIYIYILKTKNKVKMKTLPSKFRNFSKNACRLQLNLSQPLIISNV